MVSIAYVLSSLRLLIQAQNQWIKYMNKNPLYAWRFPMSWSSFVLPVDASYRVNLIAPFSLTL